SAEEATGAHSRSYQTERWSCPPLFRPVRIPSDPPQNAADGVSLDELIAGEYTDALVACYLVDIEFLLKTVPRLKKVPFLLIQGVKEKTQQTITHAHASFYFRTKTQTIHIGIHHSKMILLKYYKTGVRVVIMTCNLRPDDWGGRCQAAWYQDFPLKPTPPEKVKGKGKGKGKGKAKAKGKGKKRKRGGYAAAAAVGKKVRRLDDEGGGVDAGLEEEDRGGEGGGQEEGQGLGGKRKREDSDSEEEGGRKEDEEEEEEEEEEAEEEEKGKGAEELKVTCEFEETLIDYFEHLGGPAATWGRSLSAYDFSAANVVLVPSVPGRHYGENLYKYGHMRMRGVLRREEVHVRPGSHRVAFQVASIMNLSRRPYKWLGEITESFMAEKTSTNAGEDGRKTTAEVDVGYEEEREREKKKKEDAEKNERSGNKLKKPLGQRKEPWGDKGILEKREERAQRREAIHRRNVLGLLPKKQPKPPKRLGRRAMRKKRREEREAAAAAALIKWVGKERPRNWFFKFLRVVWPTEEAIRTSNLGWESGSGMPCLTTSLFEGGYRKCEVNFQLNRVMEEMDPLLCTWTGAKGMNRGDAMPHLNTYYRYRELERTDGSLKMSKDGLAYFLLGSHSMHRIAWGYLEHRNPPQMPRKRRVRLKPIYPPKPDNTRPYKEEEVQLDIKSFDMGVLFLPSRIPPKRPIPIEDPSGSDSDGSDGGGGGSSGAGVVQQPFSCDPDGVLFRLKPLSYRCPEQAPTPSLKTLPLGLLPIPHQLPGE
ncbi:unnamed protein product, partial [Pylaiella littoralis]